MEVSNKHHFAHMLCGVMLLSMLVAACGSNSAPGTVTVVVTQPPNGTTPGNSTASPTTVSTSTPPTVTSTPTPGHAPPAGTVLYQANTSTGWASWNVSGPWKIFQNTLVNDGTGNSTSCGGDVALLAPYTPTTPDLEITALIQFPQNYNYGAVGLVARIGTSQNTVIGYSAFATGFSANVDDVNGCNNINNNNYDFKPQNSIHKFQFWIKGTEMKLYIDGALVLAASDAKYLSPGSVGIFSGQEYIKVTSFVVTQA